MYNLYLISIVLIINTSLSAHFFDSVSAFFGKTPYQTTLKAVYPLAPDGLLTVTNIDGNISIQTNQQATEVTIYATKHTAHKQHLEHIDIIQEQINHDSIMLRTSYGDQQIKGHLDYTIIVPDTTHLNIITQKGSITIKDITGTIIAKTEQGNIHIHEADNNVSASILKQGDITIIGAKKELSLSTIKGNIQVLQSTSTVSATTVQGNIMITCKKLAAQDISCYALQGDIALYLPTTAQATIDAVAPRGIITSEQPVAIAAITTTVDKAYWQQVKTELHGHIGHQPTAAITLTTQKGNILLAH